MRGAPLAFLAVSLAALLTAPAAAQRGETRSTSNAPVLFTADEVQYDDELGLVIAKGNVEISQEDQILLADTVTYNQRTDTVTASGHVSLLQPTGDIVFADFMELRDKLHEGFIKDVRLLLSDRSRMAGNTARRLDGTRTEVRRAVYSPCELCRSDPTRPPLWQLKAEEAVHDKQLQIVEYRNATVEIAGFPVFYTPYLSHPDPSVRRQSGFLSPLVGHSSLNGFTASIPYYWAISPDKDATFRPIFTSAGGTLLDTEYRQRWGFGRMQLDGSINYGSTPEPGVQVPKVRGHIVGSGEFDLTEDWRTGFDVQRQSDQSYLLRYHFPYPYNFTTSRVYAEYFGRNSFADINAYAFQSLRPGVTDESQPIVAPVAGYTWTGEPDDLGGRLSLTGNALNLVRIQGVSTRRLVGGGEWRLPFAGAIGDRFTFTAAARGDGYRSDDLPSLSDPTRTQSATEGRVFPQLALDWRYPLVRRGEHTTQLVEPLAGVYAAPRGLNPATIPNEDSQGFEFDETSLFRRNRFPGYDRVDSGQRVDYGLRAGVYQDNGMSSYLLAGQSYRLQKNNAFEVGSGVEDKRSDVVGRLVFSPVSYLDFIYRFRLDKDDLAMRRQSLELSAGFPSLRLGLGLVDFASIPGVPGATSQTQIRASVGATLTRYWSLNVVDVQTISGSGGNISSGVSLTYQDECLAFVTSLSRSGVTIGDVHPGLSVLFTVVFKNLGEIGVRALSTGGA